MILPSKPLFQFVLIRVPSWLVSSQRPVTPSLFILPILPQIYGVIMQNKPNFQKVKTAVTSCAVRTYPNIPLRSARKNKPNQTQFQPKTRALLDPERSRRANQTRRRARGGPNYRRGT